MIRPSFTFVTGFSFILAGLCIGKSSYIIRIGNNGITIANVLLVFGTITVVYNVILGVHKRKKDQLI
jgi:hypothetical protein